MSIYILEGANLHFGGRNCLGQKNPRVRKIRVRNSGAGNGCANFMDAWKKCVLSAGKTLSIKFRVLGGGCRFYFYGRADFSDLGVLCRKGVIPKKGGTLDSRELSQLKLLAWRASLLWGIADLVGP